MDMLNKVSDCGRPKNPQQFGRAVEYAVFSKLLMSGGELFLPVVDDDGIDVLVKRPGDKKFVQVQIKATSLTSNDPGLFAAISHSSRPDYWFIFYSEKHDKVWVLSSNEFLKEASVNHPGSKNAGKYTINFGKNGTRLSQYEAKDFSRILY